RYLDDPSVPADLAAAVRKAGLIPLEALTLRSSWWCRCRWCSEVVEVRPNGHGYQAPGRCPYFVHAAKHEGGRCTRPEPDPVLWEGPASELGDPFGDGLFTTSWPIPELGHPLNGQAD
ncbi:hypothetical protein ACFQ07_28235, partial [Actinomadura adrarensis]